MKKEYLQQKVNEVKAILDKHSLTHFTTPQLARKAGINEYDLKKAFKEFFNTTIYQYQINHKMARAKELLETTEKTESEISRIVGYKHTSNFITAFTNHFQHPPHYFRKP